MSLLYERKDANLFGLGQRRHKVRTKLILAASLVILLGVTLGYGQIMTITAKIDFPFTVEGKTLPAGDYQFVPEGTGELVAFSVRSGGKSVASAQVLTRLSKGMHMTPADAHLVFDVVGDNYLLSEIWPAGSEDGCLVLATKGPHKHKVINVQR